MSLLSFLIPQTVLKSGSRYNHDIRIVEEAGKYKLLANGARESGPYIESLWKYAFREFKITSNSRVKNILVFGVAGGTVIHLLHALYPDSHITGVDIDQIMIDIGEKYFGLEDIPHLTCQACDAKDYVASYTGRGFDLIVIDIFKGPDVPDFVLGRVFQKQVKRCLRRGGFVLINYLREPGYGEKVIKLAVLLKNLYVHVRSADRYNNRFFLAE